MLFRSQMVRLADRVKGLRARHDSLAAERDRVFQAEIDLYATAVSAGALVFVLLRHWYPASESDRYIGMAVILTLRLAAMRWKLRLPTFWTRTQDSG